MKLLYLVRNLYPEIGSKGNKVTQGVINSTETTLADVKMKNIV